VPVQRAPDGAEADALRALAVALAPYLRELFGGDGNVVEVAALVPLPRRVVYAACRRGDVAGAVRVSRRWLATKASVHAWLWSRGPRVVPAPDSHDTLETLRASLARPEPQRRRKPKGQPKTTAPARQVTAGRRAEADDDHGKSTG